VRYHRFRQLSSASPGFLLAIALAAGQGACDSRDPDAVPGDGTAPPARPTAGLLRPDDSGRSLPGRFRPARPAPEAPALDAEQQRLVAELEAIGYLSGSQPARASGVTVHRPDRAQAGLNFYTSGHTEGALLIDMAGRVLHEWRYRFTDAFDADPSPKPGPREDWWRRAYLFPNGDVMAIITGSGLLKIDKDSRLLWALPIYAHHDLAFTPGGELYLLTRRVHVLPRVNPTQPIVEDMVVLLDADGNEQSSFSLLEAFESSDFADVWLRSRRRAGDLFHTNSIEWLDGSSAGANPAFAAGNLLISLLQQDAIAVVDPGQRKVVWAHTGSYRKQHDPKILPNGNLLLFDNLGDRGASAIREFDPARMEQVWEYRGTPEQPFFSNTCGTSERLANGNTLISETDQGRAFEVTPAGEIVWEFYNPYRAGEDDRFIASLPEMLRLPPDFPVDWLHGRDAAAEPSE
jgi:hypothetical protein